MIKDIRVYFKNSDIKMLNNVENYAIYTKIDTIVITEKNGKQHKYLLEDLAQVDILTRLENKNIASVDTILL